MRPLIASVIGLTLLCACEKNIPPTDTQSAYPVLIAQAISKNVPIIKETFGTLLSPDSISLTAQVNGQIIDFPVKEGQIVTKGDLIAKIDPRIYQATLESAKAQLLKDEAALKFATANVEAYKQLLPKDYVSVLNYAQYVANLETAQASILADKANIEQAKVNLEYTDIIAPVDGVVGMLQAFPWNFVNAGSQNALITTLQQIKPINALFALPESDIYLIRKYQRKNPLKVKAVFLDSEQAPIEGTIFAVNNTIDPQTGTILLKAEFPNEDLSAWPGQFVRIQVQLYELKNAVVVPVTAIQTGQNGLYTYIVGPNGTVNPKSVIVEGYYENLAIIQSGIKAGEIVVTDGQLNLYPGASVSVESSSSPNSL
jgi:multidrug efflux system membrane fusion protein